MSVSTEAKRTLVKSPPELWSELSDPQSLARHLDGLGEIRITRAEPDTAVDWEAEGATGTVRLQPSGFGTKVTLSLTREIHGPEAPPPSTEGQMAQPAASAEPDPVTPAEPELVTPAEPEIFTPAEPEPATTAEPGFAAGEPEPAGTVGPTPTEAPRPASIQTEQFLAEPTTPEPAAEPPRGFFARFFKRRRKETAPAPETGIAEPEPLERIPLPEPDPTAEPSAVAEPEPIAEPEPAAEVEQVVEEHPVREPEPAAGVAADLVELEAQIAEQDNRMLIAMLDRLGAAHHRPFSRA